MATTLTKSVGNLTKMNSLKGIKSLNLKMIAVLFILTLGSNKLIAQHSITPNSLQVLKPLLHRASTNIPLPLKPSMYTVFLVKNFPILSTVTETLLDMEENEPADLEMFCINNCNKIQGAHKLLEILDFPCTK